MTSITSLPLSTLGPYEVNSKLYGPAVATAIGAAEALTEAAESTFSFSSEALDKIAAEVSDGLGDVGQFIEDAASAVVDTVEDAYEAVADVGNQALEVAGDVLDGIGEYVSLAGRAVGNTLDVVG